MYNLKLYPYKTGSESATELAKVLEIMRVKPDGNYVPKIGHKVVNWGQGRVPAWNDLAVRRGVSMLNKPTAVNVAANKLTALQALKTAGIRIPEFTTNFQEAQRWLNNHAVVFERHELRGNSGEGIRVVTLADDEMESRLSYAPLYTKYIPKTAEFRVHVFRGEVIDYIEKKKLVGERRPANFNKYISSINLGWVFSRTGVMDLPEVRQLAIKAVATLGLDFGAVDIVFADGLPYVLEINTAPGLSGITLVKYANALRRFMGQPELSPQVIATIPGAEGYTAAAQPIRPIAPAFAGRAVDNGQSLDDVVTLRIDRGTAIKLRSLLANI